MKYIIQDIWSDSIEDLKTHQFKNNSDFFILLDLLIGDKNLKKSDSFNVQVGTAKGIERFFSDEVPVFLRQIILVKEFDWGLIEKTITDRFKKCYDDDWDKMVSNLVVYFAWEYENHSYIDIKNLR